MLTNKSMPAGNAARRRAHSSRGARRNPRPSPQRSLRRSSRCKSARKGRKSPHRKSPRQKSGSLRQRRSSNNKRRSLKGGCEQKGKPVSVQFLPSSRVDKKKMALFYNAQGECVKKVHFGAANMNDYTTHDAAVREKKRTSYLKRHGATEKWDKKMTPRALSRWVLWEYPDYEQAKQRFAKKFALTLRR